MHLLLNKGTGSGGVNALSGPLFIGDNSVTNGFSRSDVVRWMQSNQLPSFLAPVDLRTTGWLDLNGHNETIGNVDAQTALILRASSLVSTGTGTLTLIGNIAVNAAEGAGLWTPIVAAELSGNLNLGDIVRQINVPDRSELPVDFIISASISGSGGIRKTDTGILLLSGNNTYSGSTFNENGGIFVGSNTAFGTSTVYVPQGSLYADGGARSLANTFYLSGTINLGGGNNVGGGGNNLTFAGAANLAGGTTLNTIIAGTTEFSGGLGEAFGAQALSKSGFGTLVFSSAATYSGATTINQNGGAIVLSDNGALLNSTGITVNVGGSLAIDNSGINQSNRINDLSNITLGGGRLQFIGKAGAASSEMFNNLILNDNTSSSVESLVSTAVGSSAEWRINSIDRGVTLASEFVRFVGRGAAIGATTTNRIAFTVAPTRINGIVNYAVIDNEVGGLQFATHRVPAGVVSATEYFGLLDVYNATTAPLVGLGSFATTLAGATATSNVRLSASEAVTGATTANALLLANGTIVVSGDPLTLGSGLVASTGTGNEVSVTTLTLGGADANLFVDEDGSLNVSSAVSGAIGVNEVQRFVIGGTPTDATTTFTITYSGQTTANITWSATAATTAANIQAALEALSNVGASNVQVNLENTLAFTITFVGALGGINQPAITSALVNAAGATAPVITEIQAGNIGNLGKQGSGALTMSGPGANTFAAVTRVNEGIFRAEKDTAFGSTANGVNVTYGATVELANNITVAAETITLNGNGESNVGAIPLRNASGTNTWQGNVVLNNNRTAINVLTGSELIINGVVSNQAFNLFGGGTLELGGGQQHHGRSKHCLERGAGIEQNSRIERDRERPHRG